MNRLSTHTAHTIRPFWIGITRIGCNAMHCISTTSLFILRFLIFFFFFLFLFFFIFFLIIIIAISVPVLFISIVALCWCIGVIILFFVVFLIIIIIVIVIICCCWLFIRIFVIVGIHCFLLRFLLWFWTIGPPLVYILEFVPCLFLFA